jgi:hypothetical protein
MVQSFNVYCDESCHLERDRQNIMVLTCLQEGNKLWYDRMTR